MILEAVYKMKNENYEDSIDPVLDYTETETHYIVTFPGGLFPSHTKEIAKADVEYFRIQPFKRDDP